MKMSKYGKARYGTSKYGRYDISVPTDTPLSQTTRYRIRTINSKKIHSRPIVNDSVSFPSNGAVKVRLRASTGQWIYQQTEILQGEKIKLRVREISSDGSTNKWVESVVGTIHT